jgi:hypothetical protein
MRLTLLFASMVLGYTVLAQPKGVEHYDTVDYLLPQHQEKGYFGRYSGDYNFRVEHKQFANQSYSPLTKREIVLVMDELERILKANGMTLNDYQRILGVEHNFFSNNVTAENAVHFYQMGMGDRIYGFLYVAGNWSIQFSIDDSGIGFSMYKTVDSP